MRRQDFVVGGGNTSRVFFARVQNEMRGEAPSPPSEFAAAAAASAGVRVSGSVECTPEPSAMSWERRTECVPASAMAGPKKVACIQKTSSCSGGTQARHIRYEVSSHATFVSSALLLLLDLGVPVNEPDLGNGSEGAEVEAEGGVAVVIGLEFAPCCEAAMAPELG